MGKARSGGWHFTNHAMQRIDEMGLTWGAVSQVLDDPETDYVSTSYRNCRVSTRGKLAVPYDPTDKSVITVLWNTAPDGGRVFVRGKDDYELAGKAPAVSAPERPRGRLTDDGLAVRTALLARHKAAARAVKVDDDRDMCFDCAGYHDTVADALACDDRRQGVA
jgi:hypothetical protein